MITALRMMVTCRWSGRRIQRYLDADPAATLSREEMARLEAHLAVCDRCSAAVSDYRGVKAALARLAERRTPDEASIARLQLAARRLADGSVH
ncbi:hypothetical protein C6I20_14625 [Aeromicrobium sp. A1-2]|uniref:zf-HC2 domain-containing protein n=1 Tax=Aeromicrobium sp. A1-2 TaxID=2107713 RepID=UPI000E47B39E|nr:zf-HC2 domain-containing protein [Aeromicrobium sp. A1-2]AXT86291.1 hypothetical protein C6I20_14625 [Aeromicrobium sp. A1-2]